ncbi:MAG TPA: tail fiber domain-containing protein, partial [Flavobacteriales bacterium]|nr:tail fiber domain-containing protein [Flavobacteriales bacterium]
MPNFPIELRTFNLQRARLNGNVTGPIGPLPAIEFPNINRDGFFLLSGTADAFTNALSRAPFTRLHLVDNAVNPTNPVVYAQQHGFRPWQRNGVTFTGNSDQSYIGHRYAGNDNTDFVVQWSDNPSGSPWGTDRMKFVFTTEYDPAASRGAATLDGLEAIRLWPRDNIEVNVGIGDFAQVGAGDPTERVDMLDGRLRIRQLPTDPPANYLTKVLVVEDFPLIPGEHGVVKWRDISTIIPPAGCEWTMNASSPNHVYTAFGPANPECPDEEEAVGVGLDLSSTTPVAKLNVTTSNFGTAASVEQLAPLASQLGLDVSLSGGTSQTTGIRVLSEQGGASGAQNRGIDISSFGSGAGGNSWNYGLVANVFGSSSRSRGITANTNGGTVTGYAGWFQAFDPAPWVYGVSGQARGGQRRIGVEGLSVGADLNQVGLMGLSTPGLGSWPMPTDMPYIGVMGIVRRANETQRKVAIYGRTMDVDANTWAGYFEGHVNINGLASCTDMAWTSDAGLKEDVQDLTGGLSAIMELRPTTYQFNAADAQGLSLPIGLQRGFLAQEVAEVLPELVRDITYIGSVDSLGNQLSEDRIVKGLNYIGIIPVLVAAMQEQQAQIASMQQQLAACCTAAPT